MKIIRAIEEYRKRDNFLNKEYILDITTERILKILFLLAVPVPIITNKRIGTNISANV